MCPGLSSAAAVQRVAAGCKDGDGSSLLLLYACCHESGMKSVGLKECLDNGLGLSHSILCLPLRQAIHHHNLTSES